MEQRGPSAVTEDGEDDRDHVSFPALAHLIEEWVVGWLHIATLGPELKVECDA